jgi:hypothetical protein
MEKCESLLQSKLARLTILWVSRCMNTELSVLGVEERESHLQSELARLTILGASQYISTKLSVPGWLRGSHSSLLSSSS